MGHWEGSSASYFEQLVEEGYVVGPLLEVGLEEAKGSIDARRISSVGLVLGRGFLCSRGRVSHHAVSHDNYSSGFYSPPPSWLRHCRGRGESRPDPSGDADLRPVSDMVLLEM